MLSLLSLQPKPSPFRSLWSTSCRRSDPRIEDGAKAASSTASLIQVAVRPGRRGKLLHGKAETETYHVVTTSRFVLVTFRRAKVLRKIGKGTATDHTFFTVFWSLRINHVFFWISSEPVLTPLPNIAVHVVKSPGVCWETAYRGGCQGRIAFLEFAKGGLFGRNSVATEERCSCSSTAGVLPLGL